MKSHASSSPHHSMKMPFGRSRGFTLIELVVTIALATLLMTVAVPSYTAFQQNAQLSEATSEFIGAVNTARGAAMKEGRNTYLVPLDGANWSSGWRVFTDANWDQIYTAGTDALVKESPAPNSSVVITTLGLSSLASGYLLFNGSGYPKMKNGGFAAGTIQMGNANRTSVITIDSTGRVRSCNKNTTTCT